MKNLFIILAMAGMIFAACVPDSIDENINNNQPEQPDDEGNHIVPPVVDEMADLCEKMDDMVFIAYCKENFDTNKDGIVTITEAEKVRMIDISEANVFSVKGVEYFKNLNTFRAGNEKSAAPLISCNLTHNTSLTNIYFKGCVDLTEVILPSTISKISNEAFKQCSNMSNITIPESVKEIGMEAFSGCSRIERITIPKNLAKVGARAFYYSGIKDVYISDLRAWCRIAFDSSDANPLCGRATLHLGSTEVSDMKVPVEIVTVNPYAFYGCNSLTSITIHSGVSEIGIEAFDNCTNLTTIHFEGITPPETIDSYALPQNAGMSITIPEGAGEAYLDSSLSKYHKDLLLEHYHDDIPSSRKIEYTTTDGAILSFNHSDVVSHTYADGKGIIVFANDIIKIERSMFKHQTTLQTITIPDGLTMIDAEAFVGCSSLTSIIIPDRVTSIADGLFQNCSALTDVVIGKSVTSIGQYAFDGCINLKAIIIPENITKIGASAFADCSSLTSITLPESVKEFKDAFNNYHGILNINFNIPENAFEYAGFSEVKIGEDVSTIGKMAFRGCTLLSRVYFKSLLPPEIGEDAFTYWNRGTFSPINCTFYVPTSAVEDYKKTGLGNIIGYDF